MQPGSLFVGSLAPTVDEPLLRDAFSQWGTLLEGEQGVTLLPAKSVSGLRCAFICYEDPTEAVSAIENMNGTVRRVIRRVKRWRDGTMVKRWVAAGIFEAQRGFRKLRGHKSMPALLTALRATAEQTDRIDDQEAAA